MSFFSNLTTTARSLTTALRATASHYLAPAQPSTDLTPQERAHLLRMAQIQREQDLELTRAHQRTARKKLKQEKKHVSMLEEEDRVYTRRKKELEDQLHQLELERQRQQQQQERQTKEQKAKRAKTKQKKSKRKHLPSLRQIEERASISSSKRPPPPRPESPPLPPRPTSKDLTQLKNKIRSEKRKGKEEERPDTISHEAGPSGTQPPPLPPPLPPRPPQPPPPPPEPEPAHKLFLYQYSNNPDFQLPPDPFTPIHNLEPLELAYHDHMADQLSRVPHLPQLHLPPITSAADLLAYLPQPPPQAQLQLPYKLILAVPDVVTVSSLTNEPVDIHSLLPIDYILHLLADQAKDSWDKVTVILSYVFHTVQNGQINSTDRHWRSFRLSKLQELQEYFSSSNEYYGSVHASSITVEVRPKHAIIQKIVHTHPAGKFLPYYIPLDYVLHLGGVPVYERYQLSYMTSDSVKRFYDRMSTRMDQYLPLTELMAKIDLQYYEGIYPLPPSPQELKFSTRQCLQHTFDVIDKDLQRPLLIISTNYYCRSAVKKSTLQLLARDMNVNIHLHYIRKDNKIEDINYNPTSLRTYHIALYKGHYFAYDTFPDNTYPDGRTTLQPLQCNSLRWIQSLVEQPDTTGVPPLAPMGYDMSEKVSEVFCKEIPLVQNPSLYCRTDHPKGTLHSSGDQQIEFPDYSFSTSRDTPIPQYALSKQIPPYIVYLDFEAMPDPHSHAPFLCTAIVEPPFGYLPASTPPKAKPPLTEPIFLSTTGTECGSRMLHSLFNLPQVYYSKPPKTITEDDEVIDALKIDKEFAFHGRVLLIYCHNLRYDITFMMLITGIQRWFGSPSSCKGAKGYHRQSKTLVIYKDSYAFISRPLAKLPAMFQLDRPPYNPELLYKLEFPYEYFTKANNFNPDLRVLNKYRPDPSPIPAYRYPSLLETPQTLAAFIKNDKTLEQNIQIVLRDATNAEALVQDQVDVWKYAEYYCMLDTRILRTCFNIFRSDTLESTGVDVHDVYTSSSLAIAYFKKEGAHYGISSVTGPVRDYLAQSVKGGRTLTRQNKAYHIQRSLRLVDFVSLYASAQKRLQGYLQGNLIRIPQHLLQEANYNTLRSCYLYSNEEVALISPREPPYTPIEKSLALVSITAFTVTVNITNIPRRIDFPHLATLTDNALFYSNDHRGLFVLNSIDLENLEVFQHLRPYHDYTIVDGYYWNEGRNTTLAPAVDKIFKARLKHKAEGSTQEQVDKLIICSTYGKLLQRPFPGKITAREFTSLQQFETYVDSPTNDDLDTWMIVQDKRTPVLSDSGALTTEGAFTAVLQKYAPQPDHQNEAHCGAEVLAMSKRITYEVFECCYRLNIPVYYSDTDCLVIGELNDNENYKAIRALYLEIFQREIDGKQLGQLHSDFEPPTREYYTTYGTPIAREGVILGKKNLAYRVEYQEQVSYPPPSRPAYTQDEPWIREKIEAVMRNNHHDVPLLYSDGRYSSAPTPVKQYPHYRMKGVPLTAVAAAAQAEYTHLPETDAILSLYLAILKGNSYKADVTNGGKRPCFRYNRDMSVRSVSEFFRSIKCNSEVEYILPS